VPADEVPAAPEALTAAAQRSAEEVVLAFLACGGRRDIAAAAELLEDDVSREGPDGSALSGSRTYLGYLQDVLGQALGYRYDVRRCIVSADGRTVVVELDEELTESDGARLSVREAMVFQLSDRARIAGISVYTKVAPGQDGA
jgi:ketosteroid isomerase-like protein